MSAGTRGRRSQGAWTSHLARRIAPLAVGALVSLGPTRSWAAAPQASPEAYPPPPAPTSRDVARDVTEQAGVGSATAYGSRGVLELGGAAGVSAASNFTAVNVSPSVGWFLLDNIQLSGIMALNYVKAGATDTSYFALLAEPSYHLPFGDRLFGLLGVGLGMGYASGGNVGFAVAPRLGANVLVGRSGILTPALSLAYNTSKVVQTSTTSVLGADYLFSVNVGYTVMW